MKYKYCLSLVIIFFISIFFGLREVNANNYINDYSGDTIVLLNGSNSDSNSNDTCESMLGDFYKDLESIMGIIRIAGPLIVIFLTSMEYIVAITGKEDDAIKKVTNKLVTRLVLVAILFMLPSLLNLLLKFLDQNYTTCIK